MSGPKLLAGSGSDYGSKKIPPPRIRIEFVLKLLCKNDIKKFDNFLTKCSVKKYKFRLKKKNSKKFVIICNLGHLPDGNTKVKFMYGKLVKIHIGSGSGSETNCKVGPDQKKSIPDPQH
jgi:hypothetical protein